MAKFAPNETLDALLDRLGGSNRMVLCSGQPTNYTQAYTTFKLAEVTMASGDFTKAAGDLSGRKITMAAKSGVSITTSGTVDHVALVSTTDSTLRFVTTISSQPLTSGNTADIGAWKCEVNAPS